jgi:hypothetical protein
MNSRWGSRKRLASIAAALAMCVVAAACGSTVSSERRALAAHTELGGPGAASSTDAGAASTSDGASAGGDLGLSGSSGAGGATARSTSAAQAAARATTVTLPPKAAPISVGVLTLKQTNAVPALSSFHDVPLVYPKEDYAAVISWINAHGGFGGHQVNPVYYEADVVDTNVSTSEQAECATFTQDNHVAFVISDRSASDGVLQECLAKKQVPLLFDFPGYNVRSQFTDTPGLLYAPSSPDAETVLWNWVRGMGRSGYFGNGAKVGVLMPDAPKYMTAVDKSLKPALASMHLTLADTAQYNTSDTSALPGQVSGAVLKFKAENITHLLMIDTSGWGVTLLFMNDAQSQGYFPRYGLNSANSPDFLRQNVPAQQLHAAMGISWIPIIDVGTDAVPPDNGAAQLCMRIFDAAGLGSPDQTTKGVLQWFCSLVLFLKAALDQSASASTFQGAVAALGTSWESPRAGITQFGPARYTGDQSYRVLTFDDNRGYFTFLGGAAALEAAPG